MANKKGPGAPISADIAADQFPDEEAARRRDEVVKRMIATPPQPRDRKLAGLKSPAKRPRR